MPGTLELIMTKIKQISRQYQWALRKKAEGKCMICGRDIVVKYLCQTHRVVNNCHTRAGYYRRKAIIEIIRKLADQAAHTRSEYLKKRSRLLSVFDESPKQEEKCSCHCHLGGNYQDCKSHPMIECYHCRPDSSGRAGREILIRCKPINLLNPTKR